MAVFLQRAFAAVRSATIGQYLPIVQITCPYSDKSDKCNKKKDTKCEKKKEKKCEKKKEDKCKKKEEKCKKKEDPCAKKQEEKKEEIVILAPVPKKRYNDVVEHSLAIFKQQQFLAKCFPDKGGKRAAQYCEWAMNIVKMGLSVAALMGADKKGKGGCIVAASLNRILPCDTVMNIDLKCFGGKDDDPYLKEIRRMMLMVHQKLNLYDALSVDEVLDLAAVTRDPDHKGKGLCKRVVMASLQLAAQKGQKVAAAIAANDEANHCIGETFTDKFRVYTLPYNKYKIEDEEVFPETEPPHDKLNAYAGMLLCEDPFIEPLKCFKVKE